MTWIMRSPGSAAAGLALLLSAPVPAGELTARATLVDPAAASGGAGLATPGFTLAPRAAQSDDPDPLVWHQRHDTFFRKNWGVEVLGVQALASGWMLQFRYRVLDAEKAALLNEKRSKAFVIDEATDIRLAVTDKWAAALKQRGITAREAAVPAGLVVPTSAPATKPAATRPTGR